MTADEAEHFQDVHRIIPEDVQVNTLSGVKKVLSQISFAPSCVDMGWDWEVETIYTPRPWTEYEMKHGKPGAGGYEECLPAGFRLRTTFRRPDRSTGVVGKGFGRWWEVPLETTESAVVKTAYAAAKMILEHELMESFKWKRTRVFDPHSTVQELAQIAGSRYTASIP
jgi:hypothetical protein